MTNIERLRQIVKRLDVPNPHPLDVASAVKDIALMMVDTYKLPK